MLNETTSFSLHFNSKENESREVKFIVKTSKNPEAPPKIDHPFPIKAQLQKKFF